MQFSGTENDILITLRSLGIETEDAFKHNRLGVKCIWHDDEHLGNAFIRSNSSFKCYACGAHNDLIGIVMTVKKCTFPEALKYIGAAKFFSTTSNEFETKRQKESKQHVYRNALLFNLKTVTFDPDEFSYTRERGFTKEFNTYFNIKRCLEGYYKDYMIIPIKEADTFEARKLIEKELFKDFFSLNRDVDLSVLRKKYKQWKKTNHIKNDVTDYFNKGKTLYPKNTLIDKPTIFNYLRLKKDEDLYIVEGIAGIPKIWNHISKNVTSMFGSEISNDQMKLLQKFKKRKIIIPDGDDASFKMIANIAQNVEQVFVIPKELSDTNKDYTNHLIDKMKDIMEGSRYVILNVL